MADQRISTRDRVQILDQLDGTMWWLNKLAGWLGERGIESESDLLDQAAKDIATACWLLSRPLRAKPPPEAWHDGQQTAQSPANGAYPQVSEQRRQM